MKLSRSEKVRLGAFLLSGAGLLVGGMAVLAGLKMFETRDRYKVRFKESISGLEASAQVKYQGFRVGRVESMAIAKDDPRAIEVTLALNEGTVLHEGTSALLDMSGITGLKTINLTPGDPRKPRLKPGAEIPVGKSLFDKLTGSAETIGLKLEEVTNQLARWTSDENRERFESLLVSFDRLAADVDKLVVDTREPLVEALSEAGKTGAALRSASHQATLTMKDVRGELRDTLAATRTTVIEARRILRAVDTKGVKRTLASAESAMAGLDRRVSDEAFGEAVSNLRDALVRLTKLTQELDLAVRASREDFVLSLKHVRQATEDLREFSRIIAQDPSVLLRGTERGE